MTIAAYLAELERRLPRFRRRRALTEVEDHLRDSASRQRSRGLSPEAAEAAAVDEFGRVDAVARRLRAEAAVGETRIASILALGAVAFFVFPLYVVPENTLPPAPWAEKPRDIAVLQLLALGLWLLAGTLAAASSVLAWTPWTRLSSPPLEVALIALAVAMLVSLVLVVRWFAATSDILLWPLLAAPLAFACLYVCAQATGWAHSRRCLLVDG